MVGIVILKYPQNLWISVWMSCGWFSKMVVALGLYQIVEKISIDINFNKNNMLIFYLRGLINKIWHLAVKMKLGAETVHKAGGKQWCNQSVVLFGIWNYYHPLSQESILIEPIRIKWRIIKGWFSSSWQHDFSKIF